MSRRQNFRLQILKKCEDQAISYWELKDLRANSVDLDDEPPDQDLSYLQIKLFASLVVKELSYFQGNQKVYHKSLPPVIIFILLLLCSAISKELFNTYNIIDKLPSNFFTSKHKLLSNLR